MDGTGMSAQDALWLTMDRPNNLMVIDVVAVLAGVPSGDQLRAAFSSLLVRHPVFGRRAARRGTSWRWVDDPEFDVARHVVEVPLPAGAGMAEVQRYVAAQRSVSFDRDHPLWSAALLAPVVLDDGTSGSAMVTRFHHAIADGVRLTQVMLGMLDPDFASAVPKVARSGAGGLPALSGEAMGASVAEIVRVTGAATASAAVLVTGAAKGAVGSVGHVVTDPRAAATSAASTLAAGIGLVRHPDRLVDALEVLGVDDHRTMNDVTSVGKLVVGGTPRTVWTGRPGQTKAVAWSSPIPLDDVKSAARRHRATLNDVLVAALAGALRTYLAGRGDDVDEVVWMVPVNLKPFSDELPEDLGNHFALVMLDMPLTGATRSARIRDLRHRMQRIKHSDEPVLTFGLQRTISMSPARMATALTNFFANKAVGVLTNVPGPTRALEFDGIPVRQVIGFAPCSGDQPLTATIFTYAGTVTVGFASDADLVPDPQTLVGLVVAEIEDLVSSGA
jgi:diacylglycerol O-acyltransferase